MPVGPYLRFESPVGLSVAGVLLVAVLTIAVVRRIALDRGSKLLAFFGLACLTLAAGRPVFDRKTPGVVAVLVDVSPSTRGATFLDPRALDRRLASLLGDTPFVRYRFADRLVEDTSSAEMPAESTRLDYPAADAVVLFSDGRFPPPPGGPPTFPVIDPALDDPPDRAVTGLDLIGPRVHATVKSKSPPAWSGAVPTKIDPTWADPAGTTDDIMASFPPADLWPENDGLTLRLPPPDRTQRWWVGDGPPPGWMAVDSLPTDPAAYLAPSVIVIHNRPADTLPQDRLIQYVRDFGGGLVVVGGDHAFTTGGYNGTPLDSILPLTGTPPGPTGRWVLLVDGSGSTAESAWKLEGDAVNQMLSAVPPNDPVEVGSFAANIAWWAKGSTAGRLRSRSWPPADIHPNGPTNLQAALEQVADASDTPTRLLVMTDADAELRGLPALADRLKNRRVTLVVLAVVDGRAVGELRGLAAATGGHLMSVPDPSQWAATAKAAARAAASDGLQRDPVLVTTEAGPVTVPVWNRTWLADRATVIASAGPTPMAAKWSVGTGTVAALAWDADPAVVTKLADAVAGRPADPRFAVSVEFTPAMHVTVDAVDHDVFLNRRSISIRLKDESIRLPQSAPGRYEWTGRSPRTTSIMTVFDGDHAVARRVVAGRYAEEFAAIGNDRSALAELARRTGGRVIEPSDRRPIDLPTRRRAVDLVMVLFLLAAGFIIAALVRWRRTT